MFNKNDVNLVKLIFAKSSENILNSIESLNSISEENSDEALEKICGIISQLVYIQRIVSGLYFIKDNQWETIEKSIQQSKALAKKVKVKKIRPTQAELMDQARKIATSIR